MSPRTLQLTPELHRYLLDVSLREPPLLRELREETERRDDARMMTSPEQGQLLALLVRLAGARRTLEVGVFTGTSLLWTAAALPPGGRATACDVDAETMAVARRYVARAGLAGRVDWRLGPAVDTLAELAAAGRAGEFDFAYVDADKTNYGAYFDRCLELLRPGALLAFDNVLWGGRVADASARDEDTVAIRAFNRRAYADARVDSSLVPIGDGLALFRKR